MTCSDVDEVVVSATTGVVVDVFETTGVVSGNEVDSGTTLVVAGMSVIVEVGDGTGVSEDVCSGVVEKEKTSVAIDEGSGVITADEESDVSPLDVLCTNDDATYSLDAVGTSPGDTDEESSVEGNGGVVIIAVVLGSGDDSIVVVKDRTVVESGTVEKDPITLDTPDEISEETRNDGDADMSSLADDEIAPDESTGKSTKCEEKYTCVLCVGDKTSEEFCRCAEE